MIHEGSMKTAGRVFDCRNGFSWPLPDTTYRYVCIPLTTVAQETAEAAREDAAGACNECGLAVSATVTGYICKEADHADPGVEGGICEFDIAGLVAASCTTAREAVELLAGIIDEKGTFEQNIIMVTDAEEAWYMETYTGHQYAAVKMPRDCVAVFGNEFMLGDIEEGYEETIVSPELYSLPEEKGFARYNEKKNREDAAKIMTAYSLKCQEASYRDAVALYGDVLRDIMLNTDTLQYTLDYDTLEYQPKEVTPLKISVTLRDIQDKYGY